MLGLQVVLLGDFCQLHAAAQFGCGQELREGDLERSDLIRHLAGGFRCTLTENKRSDPELFDYITGLGIGTPFQKSVEEARNEATHRFKPTGERPRYTIVLSHKRRMKVNAARMREEKPRSGAVFIPAPEVSKQSDSRNLPQDLWVWQDQELIGYSGKCKRGLLYSVKEVSSEFVVVVEAGVDVGEGEEVPTIKLSHKHAVQMLRPAYCITYAACQGLTLQGRVRLETNSPNLNVKHLYVGCSRATAASLLEVV
jgi:hypothetical protein